MATSAPAGWYLDPAGSRSVRYWDGQQWTNRLRPLAPANRMLVPTVPRTSRPAPAQRGAGRGTSAAASSSASPPPSSSSDRSPPSSTSSPRVSGAPPVDWSRYLGRLVAAVLVIIALVLLAALLSAGPDADLGETITGWFA
ncbi:MAG: DUF2510 domain-containing protein [Jiangellales bacterium]